MVAIPVTNDRNHDISLTPRTVLGQLQQIKAIYPVDVRPANAIGNSTKTTERDNGEHRQRGKCQQDLWDPLVSVDHLTPDHQEMVRQMLREECSAFSKDESDVGCIPSLQLKISVTKTREEAPTLQYPNRSTRK